MDATASDPQRRVVLAVALLGVGLGVIDAVAPAPFVRIALGAVDVVLLLDLVARLRQGRPGSACAIDAVAWLGVLGWLGHPTLHALRVMRAQSLLRIGTGRTVVRTDARDEVTPEEDAWRRVSLWVSLLYAVGVCLADRVAEADPGWLVAVPSAGVLVTVGLATSHTRAMVAHRTRALLEAALPRQVAAHVARHPEDYHETVSMPATIVFVDIDGFTPTVERLHGDHVALKRHLEAAMDAVAATHLRHDLLIDKFIGDAVMSFRGGNRVPGTPEEHALRVVRAGLDSLEAIARLEDPYFRSAKVGGASTESALIGTFGASDRLAYTVLGDAVNLAARLESANRLLGTRALFCERTHALTAGAADIAWRRVGKLRVKGKAEPLDVYEALRPSAALAEWTEPFERALAQFEAQEFATAWETFAEVDAIRPGGDGPSRVYLAECNRIVGTLLPEDWQPVIRAA